ncbi:uncharacterized protein LOC123699860 [Colias croceus]|uniref:uncharacterized protein LOC123699860 n=1 Tax=Colias crocea TaxID=72248 RepID=UPI001E27F63C|nr:uncharacterized protein LOC123699860 [Colias croceus]
MSHKNVKTSNESTLSGGGEFFIDDYSHLRFSYYQNRDGPLDSTLETMCNSTLPSDDATSTTMETNVSDIEHVDERQELRNYYVSQIPELPHPANTVASIIASASNSMNSGNMRFKYADKIETAKKQPSAELEFSPSRRSTLMPKKNN